MTRTLARLLEHLQMEGHEALVLGPESGMVRFPCEGEGRADLARADLVRWA